MAEADPDAGGGEPRRESRRHLLGRQRDHRAMGLRRAEQRSVRFIGPADQRGIVHARLAGRQERAFEVDAEHARVDGRRTAHGIERRAHLLGRVGDQRRQQPGGAEFAVSGDDRGDALGGRLVVEQDVAAAVDLHVDEPWREPRAVRQRLRRHPGRHLAARDEGGDAGTVDHHGAIAMHRLAVEDGAGQHRVGTRAHRVRVIFCRWRG